MGFPLSPFGVLQVKLALRSLPFTLRTPAAPAPPFPARLLAPLFQAAEALGPWTLPFRALFLMAFFSFARLGSLLPQSAGAFDGTRFPTLADLRVGEGGAWLRLKFSKTRQASDGGFWVPFARAQALPCPVRVAGSLLARAARLGLGQGDPLFVALGKSGASLKLLTQGKARDLLGSCLLALQLPRTAFTFHSFRRGGCTFAFDLGAAESDLALQGDWHSTAIRAYYPASSARLRVAERLAHASLP